MKCFELSVLLTLTFVVNSLVPEYYELNLQVHPRYHNKTALRIKYLSDFTSMPSTRLTRIAGIFTFLQGDYISKCDRIGYNPHFCDDNLVISQNLSTYDWLDITKEYQDAACVRRPSEIFGFIQNITLDVCGLPMKGPTLYRNNFLRTFYIFWRLELHGFCFDVHNNMYRKIQNSVSTCTVSSIGFDATGSFARVGGLFNTDSRNAFVSQLTDWFLYDYLYDVCAFSNETTMMWYWRKSCFVYDAVYDGSMDVPFYNVSSGVNLTFVNWAPGEPKMYGCMAIKKELNYYWYSVPCTFEFNHEEDPTVVEILPKPERYAFVCDLVLPPATSKTMHGTVKVNVQTFDTPITLTPTVMNNKTDFLITSSNAKRSGAGGIRQLAKGSQVAASITSVLASGSLITTLSVSTSTLGVEYASMVYECDNDDNYGLGIGSDPAQSELASNKEFGATIFNLVISVSWFILYYIYDRQRNNENTPGAGLFGFYYFLQPWTYCGIRLLNTPGGLRFVGFLPLFVNVVLYYTLAYVYKNALYLTKKWKALFSHRWKQWCLVEIPIQAGFSLVAGFPAGSERMTCELQAVAIGFLSLVHLLLLLWLKPFPYDIRGNIEGATICLVDVLVCVACILAITDAHVVSSSLMILGDYLLIAASLVPMALRAFIGLIRMKEYYRTMSQGDTHQNALSANSSEDGARYVAMDTAMHNNKPKIDDIELTKLQPTGRDVPPSPLAMPPPGREANKDINSPSPRTVPYGIAL